MSTRPISRPSEVRIPGEWEHIGYVERLERTTGPTDGRGAVRVYIHVVGNVGNTFFIECDDASDLVVGRVVAIAIEPLTAVGGEETIFDIFGGEKEDRP